MHYDTPTDGNNEYFDFEWNWNGICPSNAVVQNYFHMFYAKMLPQILKENGKTPDTGFSMVEELKKDGTVDKIIGNYIGDDAGKTPYETPKDADHSKGTLTMATNATFQPYEYYDGDNIVGIDVDIAQAICDKLGYDLKVEDMEFDAIVNAVKSGKADFGAAGMTVTEDRKKSIDFTDPYTTAEQVIIVQK